MGIEEERLEEMIKVVLKLREAMCLDSSMHGKRWPCPKNGITHISLSLDIPVKIFFGFWCFQSMAPKRLIHWFYRVS